MTLRRKAESAVGHNKHYSHVCLHAFQINISFLTAVDTAVGDIFYQTLYKKHVKLLPVTLLNYK